jgi:hypothetical protein
MLKSIPRIGAKMKTKKKRTNPFWGRDDWALTEGFVTGAVLSWPQSLETSLEVLKRRLKGQSGSASLILVILEIFEGEARAIFEKAVIEGERLQKVKPDSKRASLLEIRKYQTKESEIQAKMDGAKRVIARAFEIREDISERNAEQTAVDMMRLVFASVTANLHEIVMKGIRAKTAPSRGGRVDKKLQGIILATRWALKDCRNKGALALWRHLKRELEDGERTFGGFDIGFDQKKHCLFQIDRTGKGKEIHFRAFQNYLRDVKK